MKRTIEIDMTGVEAWSASRILPPGNYVCRIEQAEEVTSQHGTRQLAILLEATKGQYAGDQIRDWISLEPQARGRLKQFLEAAGVEVPDGKMQLDLDDLVGRTVEVLVRSELWQGRERSRVRAYEFPRDIERLAETARDDSAVPDQGPAVEDDIPF